LLSQLFCPAFCDLGRDPGVGRGPGVGCLQGRHRCNCHRLRLVDDRLKRLREDLGGFGLTASCVCCGSCSVCCCQCLHQHSVPPDEFCFQCCGAADFCLHLCLHRFGLHVRFPGSLLPEALRGLQVGLRRSKVTPLKRLKSWG
jgi:hypothetical protein